MPEKQNEQKSDQQKSDQKGVLNKSTPDPASQAKSPPSSQNPPADAPWKPATVPVKNTPPNRPIIPPGSGGDQDKNNAQRVEDSVNALVALIPPDAPQELKDAAARAREAVANNITGHAPIPDANFDGRGVPAPQPSQTGAK